MTRKISMIGVLVLVVCTACGSGTRHPVAVVPRPAVSPAQSAEPEPYRLDTATATASFELETLSAALSERLELLAALVRADQDPSSTTIPADPNMRPVRVWAVKSNAGVKVLYVVGHAYDACCRNTSGLLQEVADRPEFKDGWLSYGFAELVASNQAEEVRLGNLADALEKERKVSPCKGQLVVRFFDEEDPIAAGNADLAQLGALAWKKSSEHHRPLLIWHKFEDNPRVAPALVPGGDGRLVPLEFRVPKSQASIPSVLKKNLSGNGVSESIAMVREALNRVSKLSQLPEKLVMVSVETNYRDPQLVPGIQAATASLDRAITAWQSIQSPMSEPAIRELEELRKLNRSALATANSLPLTPTSPIATKFAYGDAKFGVTATVVAEKARLRALLTELQQVQMVPRADPEPVLLDALLRGWPASFTSAGSENVFDTWVQERQPAVWKATISQLSQRGISLTADQQGAPVELMRSNVVFRVRAEGQVLVVTPLFVLAGTVVQVVDPAAGLVRYESTAADQNLVKM